MNLSKCIIAMSAILLVPILALGQERPKAAKLLPENTLVYIQIDNFKQMVEDMRDSNFSRLLQDEQMAPLVEALYSEALAAYEDVKENVGVELEDLMNLPSGEICFGLVAPKDGEFTPVFFVDVDPDTDTAGTLFSKGVEIVETEGGSVEESSFADLTDADGNEVSFKRIKTGGSDEFLVVEYQSTYMITNDELVATDIMARWLGQPPEKDRTLAENRKFITIANRCKGTKDEPAEAAFFVDPIEIAKYTTRDNFAARAIMAGILPILGLDGLLGVGGSMILDEEGYESVLHMHVLLSNPKTGIFDMLALRPGIDDPEKWVPANIHTYMTTHVDVKKLFRKLEEMIDQANDDEGLTRREIEENINEELGIDFVEDVINGLEGRLTWAQWNEETVRLNSASNIVAVKLKDPEKFREVIDKIVAVAMDEGDENLEEKSHEGYTYWQMPDSVVDRQQQRREERNAERDNFEVNIRFPQPSFGIVEEYFIFSENPAALRHVMETAKGDHDSLADSEDYNNIMDHMKRQLGTDAPSLTLYSNPREQMKWMFELANGEDVKGLLEQGSAENKYVESLKNVLEDHPLPDFDNVAKYFPPSGGFMTVDAAGYHFMVFQLRAENN